METMFTVTLLKVIVMAVPVILAVTLHEVAHGYVAFLRGDDTAMRMGRITLNPLAHVHLFGTIILPAMFYLTTGFLFAFAKPVPVNFNNLRDPRRDMIWVAAAGPFTNIVLAVASALILKFIAGVYPELYAAAYAGLMNRSMDFSGALIIPVIYMLQFSILLNTVLAIINMIPIPPADGGRVVAGLLPEEQAEKYAGIEPYGLAILIFILFINPLNILNWTIYPLIGGILNLLL